MCISPRPTMPIVWPPIRSTSAWTTEEECKNDDRTNKGGKKFPAAQATAAAAATGRPARRRVPVPSSPPPPSTAHSASASPHRERDERLRPGGGREGVRSAPPALLFLNVSGENRLRCPFCARLSPYSVETCIAPDLFSICRRTPLDCNGSWGRFCPRRVSDAHCGRGWPGRRRRSTLSERGAREWSLEYVKKKG